jgi:hypothetical protein
MTRIYEIEADEFSRIEGGQQGFIVLKDDKIGMKGGDMLILQHIPEDDGVVSELNMRVEYTLYEGLKKDFVLCALKEPSYT